MLHKLSPTGRVVLPLLLLVILPVAGLRAQQASLTGRVVDSSGAALPGAAVTVLNLDTGIRTAAATDVEGLYTVPLLHIAFSQTSTLQLRAECFNLFNRVNFNQPNVNFLSGEFGQITSAGDGRRVQFGVKLYF